MDRTQALAILKENRSELNEIYGVSKIGLFGSISRGELTPNSDIDVVVEISKDKKQLHNFLSLRRYLETKLGRAVDLGIESSLKPVVRDAIVDEIVYV